jgi:hypothetical protein
MCSDAKLAQIFIKKRSLILLELKKIESETCVYCLWAKPYGFWGASEEVPVTRDMTIYKRCNC